MPNRSKDDLARALEHLSGGQVPHEEGQGHEGPGAATAKPAAIPRPAGPVRPAAPAGQLPSVGRPSQPPGSAAPPPPRPPAGITAPQDQADRRASTPAGSADVNDAARATQTPSSHLQGAVTEDDDAVIVPAPDPAVFLHKSDYAMGASKHGAFGQGLTFRRTFIPILLSGGLICAALGLVHFFAWSSGDNPLRGLPVWLVALLFLFAVLLWGLAVMNMMVVKHMLEPKRMPDGP